MIDMIFNSMASAPAFSICVANSVHSAKRKQLMLAMTGMVHTALVSLIKLRYSSRR